MDDPVEGSEKAKRIEGSCDGMGWWPCGTRASPHFYLCFTPTNTNHTGLWDLELWVTHILNNRGGWDALRSEGCKKVSCGETWNKGFKAEETAWTNGQGRKSEKQTESWRGWSQVSEEIIWGQAGVTGGAAKGDTWRQRQGARAYSISSILLQLLQYSYL